MEPIIALAIAIIVVAVAIMLYRRASQSPMLNRAGRIIEAQIESMGTPAKEQEGGVKNLRPGDAISFWDGENCTVETVLDCEERLGERVTTWQWVFLSGDKLLELAPDGNTMFPESEVIYQGSAAFQKLTASREDGGVLKTFEEHVREGTTGSSPVSFRHGQGIFRMKSTGAFRATARGKALEQEVWRDISPKAEDNVYFEMESVSGQRVLGIWTTHIALLSGQKLKESDISEVFNKGA